LELARTCIEVLGSRSVVEFSDRSNPDDNTVWNVSIAKARRDLKYEPQFTIAESIRSLI